MAGFFAVVLALAAFALCVAGFMANSARFAGSMRSPGFYWAWGVVAVLAMSIFISVPTWVKVASFVVLVLTVGLMVKDNKVKESAR